VELADLKPYLSLDLVSDQVRNAFITSLMASWRKLSTRTAVGP
jgi:hypothetical protein